MNEGFKIVLKSLLSEDYKDLSLNFKTKYGEFEIDWLKSMIIEFHGN